MPRYDPLLVERAAAIRLLALDVDGVLTDGRLYFDSEGREIKAFYTADGLGLRAVQSCGIELALITGRTSPMVEDRARGLGINHVYQGQDRKIDAYMHLLKETGRTDAEVCYAGDDWIDLPLLRRVGLAVTVPNAALELGEVCHWTTPRGGGNGAVRDICDLLLHAQGHMKDVLKQHDS